jgi:hypothetical protein
MKRASKPLLNRLLARREGLSAPDKEQILEELLGQAPRQPKRGLWFLSLPMVRWGLAAAAASLVVLVWMQRPTSEFTARGDGLPSVSLSCSSGAGPGPCALGNRLLFKVSPHTSRYFSALALSADQRTLWYFSGVDLAAVPKSGVLEQSALLGAEHGSGVFEVVAVFSQAPLDKQQVLKIVEAPADEPSSAVVIRQPLTVSP